MTSATSPLHSSLSANPFPFSKCISSESLLTDWAHNKQKRDREEIVSSADTASVEVEEEVVCFSSSPQENSRRSSLLCKWKRDSSGTHTRTTAAGATTMIMDHGLSTESMRLECYGGPPEEAYMFTMNQQSAIEFKNALVECDDSTSSSPIAYIADDCSPSALPLRLHLPLHFISDGCQDDTNSCLSPVKIDRIERDNAATISTTATTTTTTATGTTQLEALDSSNTHGNRTRKRNSLWMKWSPNVLMSPTHLFFKSSRSSSSIIQGDGCLSPSPAVYDTPLSMPSSPFSIQSPEKQTARQLIFDARQSFEWNSKQPYLQQSQSPRHMLHMYSSDQRFAFPTYESPSSRPFFITEGGPTTEESQNGVDDGKDDSPIVSLPCIKRSPSTKQQQQRHYRFSNFSIDDESDDDVSEMCADVPTTLQSSSTKHYYHNQAHFQGFFSSLRTTQPISMNDDEILHDRFGGTIAGMVDLTPCLQSEFTEDSSPVSINPFSLSPFALPRFEQHHLSETHSNDKVEENENSEQPSRSEDVVIAPAVVVSSNRNVSSSKMESIEQHSAATTDSEEVITTTSPQPVPTSVIHLTDIPISPVPKLSLKKDPATGKLVKREFTTTTEKSPVGHNSPSSKKLPTTRRLWQRIFGFVSSQSGSFKENVGAAVMAEPCAPASHKPEEASTEFGEQEDERKALETEQTQSFSSSLSVGSPSSKVDTSLVEPPPLLDRSVTTDLNP